MRDRHHPAGPKAYNVAKDADVTVVLYADRVAKANHAFEKGELKDADIDRILSEVPTVLSETKRFCRPRHGRGPPRKVDRPLPARPLARHLPSRRLRTG